MNKELAALLDELREYGMHYDSGRSDRLERLRNLEPDTAALLAVLVRIANVQRLLELGTSNGYSTLWLADAVQATGGLLVTVDTDESRSEQAGRNLARAGLSAVVERQIKDAARVLMHSTDGQWDMIFLDAERPAYTGYWEQLVRVLRPGGLLAVDNVLSHADQVADFRSLVAADARVTEAVAPTGAGALLVVKHPSGP